MNKLRKFALSPITGSIFFLVVLVLLFYFYGVRNNSFELFVGIYGAFVATLLGIYISLYYTREQTKKQENRSTEKITVGALKLLWSELDLNKGSLKYLLEGYKTLPKIDEALYENFVFLSTYGRGIKFDVFYGLISSGAMSEISKDDDIFNALQQAYYNTELMIDGIRMTEQVYKYFNDNPKKTSRDIELMWSLLDLEIKKVERTIKMIDTAGDLLQRYLSVRGVTFSKDKENETALNSQAQS